MKNVLSFLAALIILSLCRCAPPPKSGAPLEYTLVDSLSGTKDDLYVKAHEWLAKTFVSANDVIQMQDKDAGKLIGKGALSIQTDNGVLMGGVKTSYVRYTLSITVKTGKYKCVISDFTPDKNSPFVNNRNDSHYKAKVNIYGENLLADLKKYMHSKGDDF
jgi:hypothetical protein